MPTLRDELRKKNPFDAPEQEAFLAVMRTASALEAPFAALFREHGLTPAQYNVLRILRGEGAPLPSLAVAERLVTRVPDITRLVDRLEKSGLVRRTRCREDRRIVHLSVTPRGLAALAALDRPVLDLHRRLLAHMSRADLARLVRLLETARTPPERR